jgi:hypothetical protein
VAHHVAIVDVTDKHSRTRAACRVVNEPGEVIFDSEWLAVRFADKRAVEFLGELALAAISAGTYRRPPGHPLRGREPTIALAWTGDLDDDCVARPDGLLAHAEWMSGPRNGGSWYCSVSTTKTADDYLFHTSVGITPTSGAAARWLCETVVALHRADRLPSLHATP